MTRTSTRNRSPSRAHAALAELRAMLQTCTRCAALARCRSQVVPGEGAAPAAIAFVGIAPGRLGGDRTGLPFLGDRSGRLLRAMIAHARLERVFITNLVRCNPRDARGRNRDPSKEEIANCRAHLLAELRLVRPRLVVCLGRLAWQQMAGDTVEFAPRQAVPFQSDDYLLYALYHPAYVNRGAYPVAHYRRDFARLRRWLARLEEAQVRLRPRRVLGEPHLPA